MKNNKRIYRKRTKEGKRRKSHEGKRKMIKRGWQKRTEKKELEGLCGLCACRLYI